MITFGISLQDKSDELPAEVAIWLLERDEKYPDVQFQVDHFPLGVDNDWNKKYSRFFSGNPGWIAVVGFPYATQNWFVRIIGDLTADQRREISGRPETVETMHSENWQETVGVPLGPDEPERADPIDFLEVSPNFRRTGLMMSAAEMVNLAEGPTTDRKKALKKAIAEKDWDTARSLVQQRH